MIAALAALAACDGAAVPVTDQPARAPRPAAFDSQPLGPTMPRSVLLITVDSLRPDAITDAERTPAFARLAAEGTSFEAESSSFWAKPAIAAILTGVDPERLHVTTPEARLSGDAWLLSEILRCEGFATASFYANGYLSDHFGFDQGWDTYRNYIREHRPSHADAVVLDVIAWLAAHRDERVFVHAHLIEPHAPYAPTRFASPTPHGMPEPRSTFDWLETARRARRAIDDDELRWLRQLYEAEVHEVDAALATLLDALDALGLTEEMLLVLTSDHAEALGEDGTVGPRADSPFVRRVPLLVRGPAAPPPSTEVVHAVDLSPTILEALDVEIPARVEGTSFGPMRLRARDPQPVDYAPAELRLSREECERVCGWAYCRRTSCDDLPTQAELDRLERAEWSDPCAPWRR